jgi:hypothetical protein
MSKSWPRLTQTLDGPNAPGVCRCCGGGGTEVNLQLWQEHDENDRPEHRYLWLCSPCSERIIEPHVRLYSSICNNSPAPGAMPICDPCANRVGCQCACALAKANGGPGILIHGVRGLQGFWDGRDKRGRRVGGRFVEYPEPQRSCDGFLAK